MIWKYKARFLKAFDRLSANDREQAIKAVDQIQGCFERRKEVLEGLGLKKLFSRERLGAVFEARATRALRILFAVEDGTSTFWMIGNHEDVRRFIRSFQ